jgi:hypothetical protein
MNYDDMADEALIEEAKKYSGLVHALGERLDMRQHSVFDDVADDIHGDDVTPNEAWELLEASWALFLDSPDSAAGFDALMCVLFNLIVYGHAQKWPMDQAWRDGGAL